MSRTAHARPNRKSDIVFYVPLSRALVAALKKQLAAERTKPWNRVTMNDLIRRILEQGLARVQRNELLDVTPRVVLEDEEEDELEAPARAPTVPHRPGRPRGVTDPRKLRRSA